MTVKSTTVKTGEKVTSFSAAIALLVKYGYSQFTLGSYIQREGKEGNFEFRSLMPGGAEWVMISVSPEGEIKDFHPKLPPKMRLAAK